MNMNEQQYKDTKIKPESQVFWDIFSVFFNR